MDKIIMKKVLDSGKYEMNILNIIKNNICIYNKNILFKFCLVDRYSYVHLIVNFYIYANIL